MLRLAGSIIAGVVLLVGAWALWAVAIGGVAGLFIFLIEAAAAFLAWSIIGFVVAVFRYFLTPPAPAPGDPCDPCIQLQELWNSMSWMERTASFFNFLVASGLCAATGCGALTLF